MQSLDPSEQLAAILNFNTGHAILLSVLQSCAKVCIIVLQDVLKKLANVPQESEATVREVDLMSALQRGVQYNMPGLLLL